MKSIIAAGLLLGCAHGAAIAGPYANVESNTAWYGNDYEGVVTEAHVGFEDVIGEERFLLHPSWSCFRGCGR